jgi:peflin
MSGRDSLPHFPAPEKAQRQSQGNMYQPPYQQGGNIPGGYPPGSPAGGYQVGPPPGPGLAPGYQPASPQSPQGYGQPGYNANQPPAHRPSDAPPPGVDPELYRIFKAADSNNNGQLSEKELSRALVNGDWSPYDSKTVKLMVKMFDVDRYATLGNAIMLT